MVEQWTENPRVGGSTPLFNITFITMNKNTINFLISLKNASILKKEFIESHIRFKKIIILLYKEGLIQSYKYNKLNNSFKIYFRYCFQQDLLNNLKIISVPSKKKYLTFEEISKLSNPFDTYFFSTSKGLKTNLECKELHLGGKLYFSC